PPFGKYTIGAVTTRVEGPECVVEGSPVNYSFTLHNEDHKSVEVNIRGTALHPDEWAGMFRVQRSDGAMAPFTCPIIKRGPESRERGDFLILGPFDSKTTTRNLRDCYVLRSGSYTVSFIGTPFINHLPDSAEVRLTVLTSTAPRGCGRT